MNTPAVFIATRRITKHFTYHGHPVTVECELGHGQDEADPMTLKCMECSMPFVVAQCILLMANLNIRTMVVDGAPLVRSH